MMEKISKEELLKKFRERQIKKHGGESNFKKAIESQRKVMHSHKSTNMGNNPPEKYKVEHQKKFGRAYSE